jgi:hypothetical protein
MSQKECGESGHNPGVRSMGKVASAVLARAASSASPPSPISVTGSTLAPLWLWMSCHDIHHRDLKPSHPGMILLPSGAASHPVTAERDEAVEERSNKNTMRTARLGCWASETVVVAAGRKRRSSLTCEQTPTIVKFKR